MEFWIIPAVLNSCGSHFNWTSDFVTLFSRLQETALSTRRDLSSTKLCLRCSLLVERAVSCHCTVLVTEILTTVLVTILITALVADMSATSTVMSTVTSTVVNLQCNYLQHVGKMAGNQHWG